MSMQRVLTFRKSTPTPSLRSECRTPTLPPVITEPVACISDDHRFIPLGHFVNGFSGRTYFIDRFINQGGMGRIYRAVDVSTTKPYALKLMQPSLCTDALTEACFYQEARILGGLSHKYVISFVDVGISSFGPFIVTELLKGVPLFVFAERCGPLPVKLILDLIRQLCDALEYIHNNGIIHGDVCPHNVSIAKHGLFRYRATLLDFGISPYHVSDRVLQCDQRTARIFGRPGYLSPEYIDTRKADHRADLYALGVILYELLVSGPLFPGLHGMDLIEAQYDLEPAPVAVRSPIQTISKELNALVVRALEKDPQNRFQNAHEMGHALADCQEAFHLFFHPP